MLTRGNNQNSGFRQAANRGAKAAGALSLALAFAPGAVRAHEHIGTCVEGPQMSIMFEPDWQDAAAMQDMQAFFVATGGRWTNTATEGAVAQGDRFTITYSFIPDGTAMTSSYTQGTAASTLFANVNAGFPGGMTAFKAKVAEAFSRWSELTNIDYVEVGDDGAGWPLAPGALGLRGDVRIGMHAIGEGPLAYNYYPSFGGDMALDSLDMVVFADSAGDYRGLRNVLTHEHGHGMGLAHIEPALNTHLMEPTLSLAFDGPQEDDIRGAHFLYGDWAEPNEGFGDELFVGGPLRDPATEGTQVFTVEDVTLERFDSADKYGFTAFAGAPIAIRVEPVGSTYDAGPQGGAPTTVEAKAVRNLALRLWRRTSAADNAFLMVAQIDFNAAGEDEYYPAVPHFPAGYMVAEIYSTDNVNDSQRYRLTISNAAIEQELGDPVMTVANGLNGVNDGTVVQFGAVTVGGSSSVALTIRNIGEGPLTFPEAPFVAGPGAGDYQIGDVNGEIAPDGIAVLGITFQPAAPGVRQAVLSIPNNDPTQPNFSFIVSGLGIAAAADPEPEPEPEPEPAPEVDCNLNGVEDADDIAAGTSFDCDANGTPDECETDTDGDGFIDACDNCPETANPAQTDSDGNGAGDACEVVEAAPCSLENQLVCGEDGETYLNACFAELAGATVAYAGPCEAQDPDDTGDEDNDDLDPDADDPDADDPDAKAEDVAGLCGAGALSMVPLAMAGMCGMRLRRRVAEVC